MSAIVDRLRMMREEANSYVWRIVGLVAVNAFTYGYDLNWWGAALAHPYFNLAFGDSTLQVAPGVTATVLSATQQSIGSSLAVVGGLIGNALAGIFIKRFGYKLSFTFAAALIIIGSLIQITCSVGGPRYWHMILGKTITNVAVGINAVNVPVYLTNVSPPKIRGAVVGSYSIMVGVGALIAALTIYALKTTMNHTVWLIPIGIQMATPFITLATIFLLPESPYWLLENGRRDEAVVNLRRLRPRSKEDELEREVKGVLEIFSKAKPTLGSSLKDIWKPEALQRTLTAIGLLCLFQAQGLGFVIGYIAVLFVRLGMPDPFLIIVIIYVIVIVCSIIAASYQDSIGRRIALLIGSVLCAAAMCGFSGILTAYPAPTGSIANVAMFLVCAWVAGFCTTWYCVAYTAAIEIPSADLREVTIAVAAFTSNIVGLLVVIITPYLQDAKYANLAGKTGFVYGPFSVAAFFFVYFFVPELRGRSLEEVDALYASKIPVRKMKTYQLPAQERLHRETSLETNAGEEKYEEEQAEKGQ